MLQHSGNDNHDPITSSLPVSSTGLQALLDRLRAKRDTAQRALDEATAELNATEMVARMLEKSNAASSRPAPLRATPKKRGRPSRTVSSASASGSETLTEKVLAYLGEHKTAAGRAIAKAVYGNDGQSSRAKTKSILYHLRDRGLVENLGNSVWTLRQS